MHRCPGALVEGTLVDESVGLGRRRPSALACSGLRFLPDVMALCAVVERTEALTESWEKKDVKQLGVVFFRISFVSLMLVVGRVEGVLLLYNAIINGRTPWCC